ncbi:alpha/beta fold hydrolase [Rhodoferax sp.]|jgi:dipeptidyl aminopeptidase/acylaminoacyl peptidase|uniref:alpha/beta hydrolase n=1 Tax=Rhodoferax sp. TaxID=50421 RepID=UPI0025F58CE0|nr:alpha/beta fold hydrolase [Rhodoferax sp.]
MGVDGSWLWLIAACMFGLYGVRGLAHHVILRGLRAPRVVHEQDFLAIDPGGRKIRCPTKGGKTLFGWFSKGTDALPGPAVLVMHGWGANAAMMSACLAPLRAAGFLVLLLDARCHGLSDDETFTSLPRFAEDIGAGLDWLRKQPVVDPLRLAVIGHSVGAGAALLSATRHPQLRAVVSISAFAHPNEVMRRFLSSHGVVYPVIGWYVLRHVQRVIGARFDDIAPVNTIVRVACPVLLVHGTQDEMVPFDDARRLYAAARAGGVSLMAVAGHHDPSDALVEELPQIVDFLQQAMCTDQP